MVTKLRILVYVICLCPIFLFGQEDPDNLDPILILEEEEEVNDTWSTPNITDEMTIDEEQNKSWRMGDYKYSSKPKHSWEFGLHFGHFFIDGDVDRNILGGWGVGLHLRRAINYVFSLRGSVFYGMATGIEKQPSYHKNVRNTLGVGGGLVENVFEPYNPQTGGPGAWFPSYQTRFISGDLMAIINVGNILFHKERNKWNIYLGLGAGIDSHNTRLDLLDEGNVAYQGLVEQTLWTKERFNTSAGRSEIEASLTDIYDGTYETEAHKKDGIFRLGDDLNLHFIFVPMVGISRKINKRINIGIEHQVFVSDNDHLDGIKFRTSQDQTNNADIGHYTNVRIGFNIGNFKKVTEPLYWVNPLDQAFNDLAIAKNQTQLDLVDEDNDGVIDLIDQELDTPEDCPVDTRGILLDSDGDGIADCEDREPYSRPGCQIDEFGIAQCVDGFTNEEDVTRLIDSRLEEFKSSYGSVLNSGGVASSSYTGPTATRAGRLADGSTYVLTMPTDNNGNVIATDRATKTVTETNGTTYDVVLPVDYQGNFVATDRAIRLGNQANGDAYILTSPVDNQGNFIATDKASKVVTTADGSKYVVMLPVDSNGDFIPTTTATKTVVYQDGSGYVLTLPVDEDGNFVSTDTATKTVVSSDGTGYILTLPVDNDGNFIASDNAIKTVRNADGTLSKTTVSVDSNGEIISSSQFVESGILPSSTQSKFKDASAIFDKAPASAYYNDDGYFVAADNAFRTGTQSNGDPYILTSPVDGNGNFVASDNASKVVTTSDGSKYHVTLPVDRSGDFKATSKAIKTVAHADGTGYVLSLPVDEDGDFVASDEASKTVINADGSGYTLTLPVDKNGDFIASDNVVKEVRNADGTINKTTVAVDSNGDLIVSGSEVVESGNIPSSTLTSFKDAKLKINKVPASAYYNNDGYFVAVDKAIRTGTQSNGDPYVLTSLVDNKGNFKATDKASKVVTTSDGSKYLVTLPVDSKGDFKATTQATKTISNSDGSGYVLMLPVDNKGNFIATDKATKTVINKDGTGYILTLPVDSDGHFIASDSAVKTVRNANGKITKTTVSVDGNGEIIMEGEEPSIENGMLASSTKSILENAKTDIARASSSTTYNTNGYADSYSNADSSAGNTSGSNTSRPNSNSNNSSGNNVGSTTSGSYSGGTVINSGCGDWFLPMIHYDLNKSRIKPEYYSHLHNVAQVMKKCPEICVVAQGHTDTRSTNEYNKVLSYMRAKAAVDYLTETYDISSSRIKLMYGGEENPMVLSPSSEAHHFMNRRVEFRTCDSNDFDMAAPEGASKALKTSTKKPEYYQGSKTSGY